MYDYCWLLWNDKCATGIAKDIRRDVFQKIEAFSSTEFDCFSTDSLITRSTNDVTPVQNVLLMIIRFVSTRYFRYWGNHKWHSIGNLNVVDHCFISGNDVFRSLYHILYCHTKIS